MKNKFVIQTLTWFALIWILASIIWVWYTILIDSPSSTELTEEQEKELEEMFWENWKESMMQQGSSEGSINIQDIPSSDEENSENEK